MTTQFGRKLAVNGRLLDVLAALEEPRRRQELLALPSVSSESWFDHRLRTLQAAGVVDVERRGRHTWFRSRDIPLSQSAALLLQARPDVRLGWSTSLPLRILLTLPTWRGSPTPWQIAGCGRSAWDHTLSTLQANGFALRLDEGQVIANPRIDGLGRFLDALRRQLASAPHDILRDRPSQIPTCVHLRGAEAAWRAPHGPVNEGYRPIGPHVHPDLALLVDPFQVVFAGDRELDRWDHALLHARAHLHDDVEGPRVEPRALNALAFLTGRHLPHDAAFRQRCAFYRMPDLPEELADAWRRRPQEITRFADQGHREGHLDQ